MIKKKKLEKATADDEEEEKKEKEEPKGPNDRNRVMDEEVEEAFFDLIKILNHNSNKNAEIFKKKDLPEKLKEYIELYHKSNNEEDPMAEKINKLIN